MPAEWRIRPEFSRHRRFAAAPLPLIITIGVALVVGWQATSPDPWRFFPVNDQTYAANPTDDPLRNDLQQFRTQIVGLQQEIQDLNDEVRQKVAANVTANEQLQTFASQLAVEQRKSYTAKEQRDSAVREMGSLRSNLDLACRLLRDQKTYANRHISLVSMAACTEPGH